MAMAVTFERVCLTCNRVFVVSRENFQCTHCGSLNTTAQFRIDWFDSGREPRVAPDPKYPDGINVDGSNGAKTTCVAKLPYPAKRCGHYLVRCRRCGLKVAITTAGRPDDPKSVKLACEQR
jgi:DNA-directed RNA polymerase subunit RPC12/RpoP